MFIIIIIIIIQWALGVIFYQFIYGYPPFNAETPYKIFENILNHAIYWETEDNPPSPAVHDLMNRLMTTNPETRLGSKGVTEIKEHPVFRIIDWDNLQDSASEFIPQTEDPEDTAYFDSRGLTLKDLEKELLETQKTPVGLGIESSPHTPTHVRSHRRAKSGNVEFEDFTFKHANHLREQK